MAGYRLPSLSVNRSNSYSTEEQLLHVIVVLFTQATTVVSIPCGLTVSRLLLSSLLLHNGRVIWNKQLRLVHRDAPRSFAFLPLKNLFWLLQFGLLLTSLIGCLYWIDWTTLCRVSGLNFGAILRMIRFGRSLLIDPST